MSICLPYNMIAFENTHIWKEKGYTTKIGRTGNVAPFLSKTPFEKKEQEFKILDNVKYELVIENYILVKSKFVYLSPNKDLILMCICS
jgi:hypothetical protein